MAKKELVYNVYMEDCNERKIVPFNIFNSYCFYDGLLRIKKEKIEDFDLFSKNVRSALMYAFWSKSEYEIVLTSWPPYRESGELDKLVKDREDFICKNGFFYRGSVGLSVGEKVDIYDQVVLNWDIFIQYLWENRNLIKKRKI